jgi:hypothetical protein
VATVVAGVSCAAVDGGVTSVVAGNAVARATDGSDARVPLVVNATTAPAVATTAVATCSTDRPRTEGEGTTGSSRRDQGLTFVHLRGVARWGSGGEARASVGSVPAIDATLRSVAVPPGDDNLTTAPPGWYADPYGATDDELRWWSGEAWTEHVHSPAAPDVAVETQQPAARAPRRSRRRTAAMALVAVLALVVVVVLATGALWSGSDSTDRSRAAGAAPAKGAAGKSAAARHVPCSILPANAPVQWSGPPASSFAGVAVDGSTKRAGLDEVCEAQANGVVYHVAISKVALHLDPKQVSGATKVTFAHVTSFVSSQRGLEIWLFESGDYSGQVFFQTNPGGTTTYPPRQETEHLITLLLSNASRR